MTYSAMAAAFEGSRSSSLARRVACVVTVGILAACGSSNDPTTIATTNSTMSSFTGDGPNDGSASAGSDPTTSAATIAIAAPVVTVSQPSTAAVITTTTTTTTTTTPPTTTSTVLDETTWDVTITGLQTATYDVAGTSSVDCYQTYHHWFTRQLAIDTPERHSLTISRAELDDGFDSEVSLHESFVLGDNGFVANGTWPGGPCSDSASTPDLHCEVTLPGALAVANGMLSLEHGDGPRVSDDWCEYEELAAIAAPIDVERFLGPDAFTVHAEAVTTRPLGPTDGALAFETAPVMVSTTWDVTFTPNP